MKTVESFSDLKKFGINPLTGEACRYSRRILCDMTAQAALSVAQYLGINPEGFPANMNNWVGDEPAVYSFMLDRESLFPIAAFLMLYADGNDIVIEGGGAVRGMDYSDYRAALYLELAEEQNWRVIRNPSSRAPHSGSRNIHMMTGRTL